MKDYVKCAKCGWIGLIDCREDICPNCTNGGYLMWADENMIEVEDDFVIPVKYKSKVLELFDKLINTIQTYMEMANRIDTTGGLLFQAKDIEDLINYTRTELLKQRLCDCEKD